MLSMINKNSYSRLVHSVNFQPIQNVMNLLNLYGGVPPSTSYNEIIQGPLTEKPFNDFVASRMIKEGFNKEIVDKVMKDTIVSAVWTFANWDGKGTLEDHLNSFNLNEFEWLAKNVIYEVDNFKSNEKKQDNIKYTKSFLNESITLRKCGWIISYMDKKNQLDIDNVRAVLNNNPTDICYIHPQMLDNLDAMESLVRHPEYSNCIRYTTLRVRNSKKLATIGLYEKIGKPTDLSCFGPEITDSEQFFLMAYTRDPKQWYGGSERLKTKFMSLKPNI